MGASFLFNPTVSLALDLGLFLALLAGGGLAVVFVAWFRLERLEAILVDPQRLRSSFACSGCGRIYSRGQAREQAPCPGCGVNNVRLRL